MPPADVKIQNTAGAVGGAANGSRRDSGESHLPGTSQPPRHDRNESPSTRKLSSKYLFTFTILSLSYI